MKCIYFSGAECEANPPMPRFNYKPNEEDKKDFCESSKFGNCPRYIAYLDWLRAHAKK